MARLCGSSKRIYASKSAPSKHPDDLIAVARRLHREQLEFTLVFAGSGETDAELLTLAAQKNAVLDIIPIESVSQNALPRLFGECGIFALPLEAEPWGLIVKEAMRENLPITVSREVGSVADPAELGGNGAACDADDVSGLANALRPIVADPHLARKTGRRLFRNHGRLEVRQMFGGTSTSGQFCISNHPIGRSHNLRCMAVAE